MNPKAMKNLRTDSQRLHLRRLEIGRRTLSKLASPSPLPSFTLSPVVQHWPPFTSLHPSFTLKEGSSQIVQQHWIGETSPGVQHWLPAPPPPPFTSELPSLTLS